MYAPSRLWLDHTDRFADINSELDELDREEFYRLKKVSNKKQRDQQAADAEIRKQMDKGQNGGEQENGAEPVDVLGEHEDDDVIFWAQLTLSASARVDIFLDASHAMPCRGYHSASFKYNRIRTHARW
jgi:hypothetical protein